MNKLKDFLTNEFNIDLNLNSDFSNKNFEKYRTKEFLNDNTYLKEIKKEFDILNINKVKEKYNKNNKNKNINSNNFIDINLTDNLLLIKDDKNYFDVNGNGSFLYNSGMNDNDNNNNSFKTNIELMDLNFCNENNNCNNEVSFRAKNGFNFYYKKGEFIPELILIDDKDNTDINNYNDDNIKKPNIFHCSKPVIDNIKHWHFLKFIILFFSIFLAVIFYFFIVKIIAYTETEYN
jgi:hypothetical protein